jgi:hypothetical protein
LSNSQGNAIEAAEAQIGRLETGEKVMTYLRATQAALIGMLLLGAAPATNPNPAVLVPHVNDGAQLRYRSSFRLSGPFTHVLNVQFTDTVHAVPNSDTLTWTRHYTEGPDSGADKSYKIDADGATLDDKGQVTAVETFAYSRPLFGNAPAQLEPGDHWTNFVRRANPLGPPGGILTVSVTQIDPKAEMVHLRLSYDVNARVTYPGDHGVAGYSSHDIARKEGQAVFDHGIMTLLTSKGSESHDQPNGSRLTYFVDQQTRLESPLP